MPHYHNLDDETFVKLIENDFELIKRRTDGRIQLQYHNTPDGTGQDRRWHVLHGGHTSTLLDNAEVAGFTLGAITAMDARLAIEEEHENDRHCGGCGEVIDEDVRLRTKLNLCPDCFEASMEAADAAMGDAKP